MMLRPEDKNQFKSTLNNILDLSRICGAKGYEYYIRDLLTSLHKNDIKLFTAQLKFCNPRAWIMQGFNDSADHNILNKELSNLEHLMKKNKIPLGSWFFQYNNHLHKRLKEFD